MVIMRVALDGSKTLGGYYSAQATPPLNYLFERIWGYEGLEKKLGS